MFDRMYKGFLTFYSVTKSPTLDFDIAKQIWETYLKNRVSMYDDFMDYLNNMPKKIYKIHPDTWNFTLVFLKSVSSFNEYNENDAWPLFIDDFMAYVKEKKGLWLYDFEYFMFIYKIYQKSWYNNWL